MSDNGTDTSSFDVDPDVLRRTLDGRWWDMRERSRTVALRPYSPPTYEMDTETHRAAVLERLGQVSASGLLQVGFPAAQGGADDIGGGMIAVEMLGFRDLSLMVKCGVRWGLFGGAIQSLRTPATYLPDSDEFEVHTPEVSAQAFAATVDQLCARLRPHVETLIDGFGIPEEWVEAPIAKPGSIS